MKNILKETRFLKSKRKFGFSLPEVIVALGVFSMVSGGLLSFHVQMLKGGLFSEQKNMINRDMRKVTTEFNNIAKAANYFVLYKSFESVDRNTEEDRLYSNRSGDFVVFVFTSPSTSTFGSQPVNRIVGYFREPQDLDDVSNVGPVLKFDVNFNTPVDIGDKGNNKLEDLFPIGNGRSGNFDQVVELSKGLANGKLFYNFEKKSIMVNGQIFHGHLGNRITDTYNFTVSPRG
jgi:prepilin-type N-terminal cleavage/methylation domain-containing protein